jgi:uncharacterized protein (TIGR03085 family)
MSRTERTALCDTALLVGADQPTLSGEWTVKDLVVHLLLREGHPAAVGLVVPPLQGLLEAVSRRTARQDFTVLVERLREGPPFYSPFAVPKVDAMMNTLEFFVHHEDIRRAQPTWEPRHLSGRDEHVLWKSISVAGKGLVRGSDCGVTLVRSDTGDRVVVNAAEPMVEVRGLPGEVAMFVYGRKEQAKVDLDGPADAVRTLCAKPLGI